MSVDGSDTKPKTYRAAKPKKINDKNQKSGWH